MSIVHACRHLPVSRRTLCRSLHLQVLIHACLYLFFRNAYLISTPYICIYVYIGICTYTAI